MHTAAPNDRFFLFIWRLTAWQCHIDRRLQVGLLIIENRADRSEMPTWKIRWSIQSSPRTKKWKGHSTPCAYSHTREQLNSSIGQGWKSTPPPVYVKEPRRKNTKNDESSSVYIRVWWRTASTYTSLSDSKRGVMEILFHSLLLLMLCVLFWKRKENGERKFHEKWIKNKREKRKTVAAMLKGGTQ